MSDNEKPTQKIKAISIDTGSNEIKKDRETSRNVEDPFKNSYGETQTIEPPYPLEGLSLVVEMSNILPQCINAMEQNCEGFGQFFQVMLKGEEAVKKKVEIEAERKRLEFFFEYVNYEKSFTEIRKLLRRDYEVFGFNYMEVLRDGVGNVSGFEYIKAITMRLGQLSKYVDVDYNVFNPITNKYEKQKYKKRFRTFVQIVDEANPMYFKEFGDPRTMNALTGKTVGEDSQEDDVDDEFIIATEIIYRAQDSTNSHYGTPRWIGNVISARGSRSAEEVNLSYFDEGTVPPYLIAVSGGKLAKGSVSNIRDHFKSIKGTDNKKKVLVIEAEGGKSSPSSLEQSRVKVDVTEMNQMKDADFLNYDEKNRNKIRSSFRMPDLYTGENESNTYASAKAMKEIAEEQVFGPEKVDFDFIINRKIFSELEIKYHKFVTKSAPIDNRKDQAEFIKLLTEAGMTYGEARQEIAKITDVEMSEINEMFRDMPVDLAPHLLQLATAETEKDGTDTEKQKSLARLLLDMRGNVKKELEKFNKKEIKKNSDK